MESFPFKIPKSLNSYVEQFEGDPEKVIEKLKKQVRKRGQDAVGHFLLSWFYHVQEDTDNAIHHSLIAKTYAPGSPLMEHLHYFLIHPEKFEATVPKKQRKDIKRKRWTAKRSPKLDLDKLIDMLSAVEGLRIQLPTEGEVADDRDLSTESEGVDDIITESIAKIHISQGKKKEALRVYSKLIEKNSDKAAYYQEKIDEINSSK